MNLNKNKRHHTICTCTSPEHTMHWDYVPPTIINGVEDWPEEVFCTVSLQWNDTWYKRILKAVKYILGHRCAYGHFDCYVIEKDEAKKLVDFLKDYVKE